ncbi:bifunctional adenosylcobinamide kinase/adenosylcobinamide-phosphate guanylyltransferase [Effusibacillus consociatus]|uniref:Adenosylcobinamide kinase n=1 Tax=Effusibacillus consociatus TaxID=1117041 RepID=A0ABV9PY79_9BACL
MNKRKLILVIGGSRSGKSRFAEQYCTKVQQATGLPVTYLATCPKIDSELEQRIAAHIERRPAEWGCIEETADVANRIRELDETAGVLLLDCLSLLLNNWMWDKESQGQAAPLSEKEVLELTRDLIEACRNYPHPVVVVTSEVGAGIVPESKLLRQYRDYLGLMNQLFAGESDAVYALIAGIPVNLKEIQAAL